MACKPKVNQLPDLLRNKKLGYFSLRLSPSKPQQPIRTYHLLQQSHFQHSQRKNVESLCRTRQLGDTVVNVTIKQAIGME